MNRQRLLEAAMARAGIGKAWRRRAKKLISRDFSKFLEKTRRRSLCNAQWKEAYDYYVAASIATLLETK